MGGGVGERWEKNWAPGGLIKPPPPSPVHVLINSTGQEGLLCSLDGQATEWENGAYVSTAPCGSPGDCQSLFHHPDSEHKSLIIQPGPQQ